MKNYFETDGSILPYRSVVYVNKCKVPDRRPTVEVFVGPIANAIDGTSNHVFTFKDDEATRFLGNYKAYLENNP